MIRVFVFDGGTLEVLSFKKSGKALEKRLRARRAEVVVVCGRNVCDELLLTAKLMTLPDGKAYVGRKPAHTPTSVSYELEKL